MASPSKITVRTGRGTRSFNSGDNSFADYVAGVISHDMADRTVNLTEKRMKNLKARVGREVDNSILRIMPFIANNIIGLSSRLSNLTLRPLSGPLKAEPLTGVRSLPVAPRTPLTWRHLSQSWMREKGNSQFFVGKTGQLRNYIASSAGMLLSGVGETRVTFTAVKRGKVLQPIRTGNVLLGALSIHMAPKVYPGLLPGLFSRDWTHESPNQQFEQRLGMPGHILEKLAGPQNSPLSDQLYRPLVQPIVQFWLLFKLPVVARKALQKAVGLRVDTRAIFR